jgi:DNA-binding NarL/FixJ family response regulator
MALNTSQRDGAHARGRLAAGRWLLLRGGQMHRAPDEPAQVAVTLGPAPRARMISVLLRLPELSAREREVAEFLVLGYPIDAVAVWMHLSPQTLRDHVKSIFGKADAGSRPELMAIGSDTERDLRGWPAARHRRHERVSPRLAGVAPCCG